MVRVGYDMCCLMVRPSAEMSSAEWWANERRISCLGDQPSSSTDQNEKSQYPRKNSSSSAIRRTCQSSRGRFFTFSRHLPSSVKVRDTSNIGLLLSSRTEIVCSPRLNITD